MHLDPGVLDAMEKAAAEEKPKSKGVPVKNETDRTPKTIPDARHVGG